jgi:uncharacterized membrane protein
VSFLLLTMRLLHILAGVVWVGTVVFTSVFLLPAARNAGPEGAKIIGALGRRVSIVLPYVAWVNILAGLWLFWRLSGGFQPAFMRSGTGVTFSLGGAAAIAALAIGIVVARPAMMQSGALVERAAQAPAAEREALQAEAQRLRVRGGAAAQVVTLLLVLAVAAMALARYV